MPLGARVLQAMAELETPLGWKGLVELRTKEIARLPTARLNECHR
jgi:hypothetical protein